MARDVMRCLRALLPATPRQVAQPFKAYEPGCVHADVK